MIALNHILVATDFSEPSAVALTYGRELSRRFGATLHVLHVVQDLAASYNGIPLSSVNFGELQAETEVAAMVRVQALLSTEDRKALQAKAVVLTSTSPAEAILNYARETVPAIDCIVMGTHGRGAIARLLAGAVAERVVRSAPCPVLTVRHPEHEFVFTEEIAESSICTLPSAVT